MKGSKVLIKGMRYHELEVFYIFLLRFNSKLVSLCFAMALMWLTSDQLCLLIIPFNQLLQLRFFFLKILPFFVFNHLDLGSFSYTLRQLCPVML